MNPLLTLVFVVGTALALGRGLDLGFWTDLESGLCIAGSVWLRYAALGIAVLVSLFAGRKLACEPKNLQGHCKPSGIVTAMAGAFFTAAGFLRFAVGMTGAGSFVRAILEILCGQWLAGLAKSWLRKDWKTPTRSLTPAVLGSAVFYWCVLARFMENSSSWHRVAPTAMVWQLLAGLVFLSALARALYLPGTSDGRTLCAGGLAAFALCLCWELPQLAADLPTGPDELPEFFFGLGLCCIGLLGLACTLRCAAEKKSKHSVG
mgnify:CR=1 FL=1